MLSGIISVWTIFAVAQCYFSEENYTEESKMQPPTVIIAIIARNAAHSLPYYLGALERLNYPKERISIWAATDHNIDNTTAILREWLTVMQTQYHYVEWRPLEKPTSYVGELGPKHWTNGRYEYVMKLKQAALNFSKKRWADYILYSDTDNILTNPNALHLLMAENKSVIAPMLDSQSAYSNYWCGITPQGYYRRTAEYFPTKQRQRRGCYPVPMVHSTILLDLRKEGTKKVSFHPPHKDYSWPFDDIIVFAFSCRISGMVQMYLCNKERYGYLNVPAKPHQTVEDDRINFVHLYLESLIHGPPMYVSRNVHVPPKQSDLMGFDEIYLINLRRRPDRRDRMLWSLYELEIDAKVVAAVDGAALNSSDIKILGVDLLPGYYDPFSGRTLTKGEVGCFLSHYYIWKEVKTDQSSILPVLFNLSSDPREDYKSHFPNRNLMVYSTHPLLVQPCHYAGDPEWVSDTETSTLWDDDNVRTDWRGSHKTLKGSQPPAGLQSATHKDEL
uniref:Probable inactive glycosyltransferase 25 family member 3 n=1 Tax=Sinocyclocheilus rhinocerous TaxID=307959 RepID=A0A673MMB0_9TELE